MIIIKHRIISELKVFRQYWSFKSTTQGEPIDCWRARWRTLLLIWLLKIGLACLWPWLVLLGQVRRRLVWWLLGFLVGLRLLRRWRDLCQRLGFCYLLSIGGPGRPSAAPLLLGLPFRRLASPAWQPPRRPSSRHPSPFGPLELLLVAPSSVLLGLCASRLPWLCVTPLLELHAASADRPPSLPVLSEFSLAPACTGLDKLVKHLHQFLSVRRLPSAFWPCLHLLFLYCAW